jgi:hypothetical protein
MDVVTLFYKVKQIFKNLTNTNFRKLIILWMKRVFIKYKFRFEFFFGKIGWWTLFKFGFCQIPLRKTGFARGHYKYVPICYKTL